MDRTQLASTLRNHVATLTETIGERHAGIKQNLDQARDYISDKFASYGLSLNTQTYPIGGQTFDNIEATLAGKTNDILILGAHYDSVEGSPGADDNASGVAGLLALAEGLSLQFKQSKPQKTIRFVAFTNEESPYAGTINMGSLMYAKMARARGDNISKVLVLEMLGFYLDAKGSQRYPLFLDWVFPPHANFIAVVSNIKNLGLVREVAKGLKRFFPVEKLAAPAWVRGVDYSDHRSFWEVGYPSVMLTDTAFFRNKNYHTLQDTTDSLNFSKMANLIDGLSRVVTQL